MAWASGSSESGCGLGVDTAAAVNKFFCVATVGLKKRPQTEPFGIKLTPEKVTGRGSDLPRGNGGSAERLRGIRVFLDCCNSVGATVNLSLCGFLKFTTYGEAASPAR